MREPVIVRVLLEQGHGVARGEVEDHDVVALHMPQAFDPLVAPMRPVEVGLAVEEWHRVLHQREGEGRVGYTRPIAQFADEKVVAHEERFLERGRGDLVVLKHEQIDEIHGDERKEDVVHPFQRLAYVLVFRAFPCAPGDKPGEEYVRQNEQPEQQPEVFHPNAKQDVQRGPDAEADPLSS